MHHFWLFLTRNLILRVVTYDLSTNISEFIIVHNCIYSRYMFKEYCNSLYRFVSSVSTLTFGLKHVWYKFELLWVFRSKFLDVIYSSLGFLSVKAIASMGEIIIFSCQLSKTIFIIEKSFDLVLMFTASREPK